MFAGDDGHTIFLRPRYCAPTTYRGIELEGPSHRCALPIPQPRPPLPAPNADPATTSTHHSHLTAVGLPEGAGRVPGQDALTCPGPNRLRFHDMWWVPAKWVSGADGALGQFYVGVRVPLIEARSATLRQCMPPLCWESRGHSTVAQARGVMGDVPTLLDPSREPHSRAVIKPAAQRLAQNGVFVLFLVTIVCSPRWCRIHTSRCPASRAL